MASVVEDKKKSLLKYVNCKRRSEENIELILVEDDHLTNIDEGKTEGFNVVLASVLNNADGCWAALSESEDHEYLNSNLPFVGTDIAKNLLCQLNIHKSTDPSGIHSRVLKKLVML